MPVSDICPVYLEDYREQLMAMLSSAREIAASNIQRAQKRYKHQHDCHARPSNFRVGDWVFVWFPQDESGRFRKLSRPWHGPYRVLERKDPDFVVAKVYDPQHGQICVHQDRVCGCPDDFPAGYYWYGGKQKGPPKWVERLLDSGLPAQQCDGQPEGEQSPSEQLPQRDYADSVTQNMFEQNVTPLFDTGLSSTSYRPGIGDMQEDCNFMTTSGSYEETTQEQGIGREATHMTLATRTPNQLIHVDPAETPQDSEMDSAETAQDSELDSAEPIQDPEMDSAETTKNSEEDLVQSAEGPTRASRLRKNVKPPNRLM